MSRSSRDTADAADLHDRNSDKLRDRGDLYESNKEKELADLARDTLRSGGYDRDGRSKL